MFEIYQQFDRTMPFLPSKCQAHAMLIEQQRKLEETRLFQSQRADAQRRYSEALKAEMLEKFSNLEAKFEAIICKYLPHASNPQPLQPPDPPDFNRSELISAIKPEAESGKESDDPYSDSSHGSMQDTFDDYAVNLGLETQEEPLVEGPDDLATLVLGHVDGEAPAVTDDDAAISLKENNAFSDCDESFPVTVSFPSDSLIETYTSIQKIKSSGAKEMIATYTTQDEDSSSEKEPMPYQELNQIEALLYPHKSTGSNLHHNAHQLLDTRCLKVHRKKLKTKCLKSWRFKFKTSLVKARPRLLGRISIEELQSVGLVDLTSELHKLLVIYEYFEMQRFSRVTKISGASPRGISTNAYWETFQRILRGGLYKAKGILTGNRYLGFFIDDYVVEVANRVEGLYERSLSSDQLRKWNGVIAGHVLFNTVESGKHWMEPIGIRKKNGQLTHSDSILL